MDYAQGNIRSVISGNIGRLLESSKKTRREVCDELGFKYTTFCDWLKGKSTPKLESLDAMSKYFGVAIGDFFVDFDNPGDVAERLSDYASRTVALDLSLLNTITDDQLRELLKRGFTFKHKTLEEYIAESGEKLVDSPEIDWGEPVGDEIW